MKDRAQIDTAIQPVGMWAVFRHTRGMRAARFVMLHYTPDAAKREAERLASITIQEHGTEAPIAYYVVKIVGRAGLIDGRLISETL